MINVRTIRKLVNGGGLTLHKGVPVTYKTGYQVALYGVEVATPEEASKAVRTFGGNCGIWFENGVYYIDVSHRVKTKRDALTEGRAHNQISILKWQDMSLVYC